MGYGGFTWTRQEIDRHWEEKCWENEGYLALRWAQPFTSTRQERLHRAYERLMDEITRVDPEPWHELYIDPEEDTFTQEFDEIRKGL